ncbi:MAG: hypothetical protein GX561_05835 [Lentisphaerae bacterium]|nr:hypothetical protein [Lentisphaerota bacterium]
MLLGTLGGTGAPWVALGHLGWRWGTWGGVGRHPGWHRGTRGGVGGHLGWWWRAPWVLLEGTWGGVAGIRDGVGAPGVVLQASGVV